MQRLPWFWRTVSSFWLPRLRDFGEELFVDEPLDRFGDECFRDLGARGAVESRLRQLVEVRGDLRVAGDDDSGLVQYFWSRHKKAILMTYLAIGQPRESAAAGLCGWGRLSSAPAFR